MITHIFNSSIVSGPEILVIPALQRLRELDGEAVSIVFLTESRRAAESEKPVNYARQYGHSVYSVPVRGRWDRQAFRDLRDVLDRLQSRVVHAHDVKASVYLHQARKARPGFTAKTVSTHHGAAARSGKIRLYEEFYVRFILPAFDRVLAVCSADRHSITRRGVAAEKVVVHLNGTNRPHVEPRVKSEVAAQIRRSWKQKMPTLPDPADAVFMGAVARLSPEKRHDRMLHVLRHLQSAERAKNAVLVCFGTGAEEERLRALARELGVEDRVYWMGYSNTISNEIAGFDLLLSLSDGEGIPINLLEAGWAGTPVVATQVGGIPDLIPSSDVGILVQREDSDRAIAERIQVALQNRESLAQLGANFQKRVVSQFSEEAWLNQLKEIYRGLQGSGTAESSCLIPDGSDGDSRSR